METDPEILTVKEICDLLRVHPSTVYKLISKGKISSFKISSEWRFRKDIIVRWLDEKYMRAQLVRKVIESDTNGGVRHWPATRFRRPEN